MDYGALASQVSAVVVAIFGVIKAIQGLIAIFKKK